MSATSCGGSPVVRLVYSEEGIATVAMEDRASKNTFSPELVTGLFDVFARIRDEARAKVVLVHGFDNYFCCGGTQAELLAIQEGRLQFTDARFFDLLLQCEVPALAAMQGHALGGGLAFGCFADLIVLAEECLYSANFMRYGFTPGMGATYIVPRKFGEILGAEMLYGAANYHGGELKSRGAGARVVKKAEVIATATALARELAEKPRIALLELKRTLAATIRAELPRVIEREVEMHRVTFAQPGVRARIEGRFGQ